MDGVRPWERRIYALCLRSFPRAFREANGEAMWETFVDRRRATGFVGMWRLGDTALECLNLLGEGLRSRVAVATGEAWGDASSSAHWNRTGSNGREGESIRDVMRAVRTLLRRPVWSLLVVATLGAGIGATTAVFSVVDAVALRDLPYDSPSELLRIGGVREGRPGLSSVSGPNFRDLESSSTRLASVAASTPSSIAVGVADGPADQIRGGSLGASFPRWVAHRSSVGRSCPRTIVRGPPL